MQVAELSAPCCSSGQLRHLHVRGDTMPRWLKRHTGPTLTADDAEAIARRLFAQSGERPVLREPIEAPRKPAEARSLYVVPSSSEPSPGSSQLIWPRTG